MLVFFYIFNIEERTLFLKANRFVEAIKEGVGAELNVVELDVVGYNRAYKERIRESIIDIVISIVGISIVDMFSKEVTVL